ncbi:hypothetical protein LZ30DRAFT_173190 [Colletotrichum cereale]|nr:hypothetical protein LZ30DRAFT_173190 [Colletotrichum cereale]
MHHLTFKLVFGFPLIIIFCRLGFATFETLRVWSRPADSFNGTRPHSPQINFPHARSPACPGTHGGRQTQTMFRGADGRITSRPCDIFRTSLTNSQTQRKQLTRYTIVAHTHNRMHPDRLKCIDRDRARTDVPRSSGWAVALQGCCTLGYLCGSKHKLSIPRPDEHLLLKLQVPLVPTSLNRDIPSLSPVCLGGSGLLLLAVAPWYLLPRGR